MSIDRCPACGATTLIEGNAHAGDIPAAFVPRGYQWWKLSLTNDIPRFRQPFTACLTCGFTWSRVDAAELRGFIGKRCNAKARELLAMFGAKSKLEEL